MIDSVVRNGSRAVAAAIPIRWRLGLVSSPLAPVIRSVLNRCGNADEQFPVMALSEPLSEFRMHLDWHAHKGYLFGTYEPDVARAIQACVQPGQTVIEVGAHIGYFTLLFAKMVGPKGRVIAFEPWVDNARVLQMNVALNRLTNVTIESKAVVEGSRVLTLHLSDDSRLPSTASIDGLGKAVEVDAVSIDDYVSAHEVTPSIIKIDVEGAEEQVLSGMRRTLDRARPCVLVELHRFDVLGPGHPALGLLRNAGYRWRFLDHSRPEVHAVAEHCETA